MAKLSGLEPKKVFEFFEYINSVPRGSGNTSAVSELCMKFAKERSLTAFKDKLNNVIVYNPATSGYENKPAVITIWSVPRLLNVQKIWLQRR